MSKVVAAEELHEAARAEGRSPSPRRPRTTCGWRSGWSARASITRSPTTCSSNGTGSPDSMATEDLREGVTAFFEGREAKFTGG